MCALQLQICLVMVLCVCVSMWAQYYWSLMFSALSLYVREMWYMSWSYVMSYIIICILLRALWCLEKKCRHLVSLGKVNLLMVYGVYKRFLEGGKLSVMSSVTPAMRRWFELQLQTTERFFGKETQSQMVMFSWDCHHMAAVTSDGVPVTTSAPVGQLMTWKVSVPCW